jgi:hypothetical protein
MLTTPFNKTKAYRFGFIDQDGKRIKKIPNPEVKGSFIENNPKTPEEKNSMTPLHRLVFNLKKLIEKVPGGKSQIASYAVALALLKENAELSNEQFDELEEKFYSYLKKDNKINSAIIEETLYLNELETNKTYRLRQRLSTLEEDFDPKTQVEILQEYHRVYGVQVYIGYIGDTKVLVSSEDVY